MQSVLTAAAEAILWPFGIRRKRRGDGADHRHDDADSWHVDSGHFLTAVAGALFTSWALARLRSQDSLPASSESTSSAGGAMMPTGLPRIPLSDFLRLLRAGAVTTVTFLSDRPPAGSLIVRTALPALAIAGPLASVSGAAAPSLPASASGTSPGGACSVTETLLLPGCHQSLFEELRSRDGVKFECADLPAEDLHISRLSLLIDIGGLLASVAALVYVMRNSNQGLFSGKHLEEQAPSNVDHRAAVTFDDVAGMESTKEELREVISFLRDPVSFYALGAKPPRGILLTGPSGTGKTLLARAVAGEAGVPFLYASSAAFVEIFVGQGAQRIRQFFEQARGCAPCIVFLDELDAVGASRQMVASGGNQEYAQTLNQLLVELDGVESNTASGSGDGSSPVVVTMAATNRYDCLDEALVRPGRLDRIVMVGLPNLLEREATLRIHSQRLRTEGLDLEALARRTEGRSGAELAGILNEAALLAARRRSSAVRMEHVEEVLRNPRPQQKRAPQAENPFAQGPGASGGGGPEDFWMRTFAAAVAAMDGRAQEPASSCVVQEADHLD